MTDIDGLLRAAADSLPDNPALAEQVVRAGQGRRHRRRVLVACATVAALATGGSLAAVTLVAGHKAAGDERITVNTTPKPAGPRPDSGRSRITFGPVTFTLPPAWKIVERASDHPTDGAGDTRLTGETLCIGPATARPSAVCAGILLQRGWIRGAESRTFVAHQDAGWLAGTGVSPCPVDPTDGPENLNGLRPGRDGEPGVGPVQTGFRPVGNRTAIYDQWIGHCDSGLALTPESWYLPQSKVRILTITTHPETAALLRSVTFH